MVVLRREYVAVVVQEEDLDEAGAEQLRARALETLLQLREIADLPQKPARCPVQPALFRSQPFSARIPSPDVLAATQTAIRRLARSVSERFICIIAPSQRSKVS